MVRPYSWEKRTTFSVRRKLITPPRPKERMTRQFPRSGNSGTGTPARSDKVLSPSAPSHNFPENNLTVTQSHKNAQFQQKAGASHIAALPVMFLAKPFSRI